MLQQVCFTDKSFDYSNTSKYHLSLQVSLKGFSFSVLDGTTDRFVAFGHYPFARISTYKGCIDRVEGIIAENKLLQCKFLYVKVMFATTRYTFVPSALFQPQDAERWFNFNFDTDCTETLKTNYAYSAYAHVVFAVPLVVCNFVERSFPTAKLVHQSVPMIEEILLKSKLELGSAKVYLNIYPDFFDFVLIEDNQLKFYNSFNYKTKNDFAYFFLNVVDNLKLNQSEVPVCITGQIATNHELVELIKEYIKNVRFFDKPSQFDYSYGFNELPSHYFTNLTNLYLCE